MGAAVAVIAMFAGDVVGWFTTASHWHGAGGIPHRAAEHAQMAVLAVVVAGVVAVPLGLVLGHTGRAGFIAVNVSNVGRAIPSFAILALAEQVVGIGAPPAFIALVALAFPPMLTNAYVAVREVDPDVRETAAAMGMSGRQVLTRVEVPLAVPLLMAGVRTAAVQVVATATLAALIAWGGLGRFIVDGFAQHDDAQVFAGALLVAAMALATEVALGGVQRLLTAPALRAPAMPAGLGGMVVTDVQAT